MKEIVSFFMRSYNMNQSDAKAMFYDMQSAVMAAIENDDLWEIDSILADYGLEPDYIMDVVGY